MENDPIKFEEKKKQ